MSGENLTVQQVNEITGDDITYWISNPFMTPDLLADKVCWWITLAITPTPVPSGVAETTAGEREVEALAEVLSWTGGEFMRWYDDAHPDHNRWSWRGDGHGSVMRDEFRDQARAILASDWLAALLDRVRVVEGERDDLMALAVEDTRRRGEAIARAESAEAAHEEAEQHIVQLTQSRDRAEAAHERLRAGVEALADEWAEDYPGPNAACNRTPDEWATDLRALLGGGGAR